jgi:acetoacetyl-CoA synthetase
LFSSGTTGRPKGIVHGAGGTLLEHVKEHRLHTDIRRGELLFYQTSLAWMMWNWQLSALASGAGIVCYDGAVTGPDTLWNIVASERVTVFGTSPAYLQLCEELRYPPARSLDLSALRAVLSTGSILHDQQYDWVREQVGDVPLQSISGGTDIVGCFVLGNPNLAVERGTIQCRSLGLDVRALPVTATVDGGSVGELVCCNAFPSRPLGFIADPDGTRFHDAYFAGNPGLWTHGDLTEIDELGRVRMHGRSDGVLNVNGVRIGPAEIYRVLSDIAEVREALAVQQDLGGASRVVLFVVLCTDGTLDRALVARIRHELARRASPLHVPNVIVEVDELPRTHSGKHSERAARDAVNGVAAVNAAALVNPHSLGALCAALDQAEEAIADADADPSSTECRMRVIWEGVLGVAPIGLDENFFDLGGTSLGALRLLSAIHDRLDVDLPLSAMLHSATPRILAALVERSGNVDLDLVVPMRAGAGTSARPLFVVHGLLGDVFQFRWLVARVDTPRPIYGVRARGLDPNFAPHTSVEAMAEEYVRQIKRVQPVGPYAIAGYSFGGLVAFEIARQLVATGERVDRLILFDAYVHERALGPTRRTAFLARRVSRRMVDGVRAPREFASRIVRRTARRVAPRLPIAPPPTEDVPLPPRIRTVEHANMQAFDAYVPGQYSGRATFVRANGRDRQRCDPLPIWSRAVARGLTIECVAGNHFEMLEEPFVAEVAERLAIHLATATEPTD